MTPWTMTRPTCFVSFKSPRVGADSRRKMISPHTSGMLTVPIFHLSSKNVKRRVKMIIKHTLPKRLLGPVLLVFACKIETWRGERAPEWRTFTTTTRRREQVRILLVATGTTWVVAYRGRHHPNRIPVITERIHLIPKANAERSLLIPFDLLTNISRQCH